MFRFSSIWNAKISKKAMCDQSIRAMHPKAGRKFLLSMVLTLAPLYGMMAQYPRMVTPPEHIKTVVLQPVEEDQYIPIVELGTTLTLSFDDLTGEQNIYSYKIEHCDYNWEPSMLSSTEYMSGYSTDRIRNYQNSFNTLQFYTHYELEIPNDNNRILKSGNYLVSVLNDNGEVLFNRRFIYYEPLVNVGVTAHRSTDPMNIQRMHSVQFVINHQNLQLNDPNREVKVDVYQNGDWNSVLKNILPKFVRGQQLFYNHVDGISYFGGNEFLYFDTKEIRNATNNIYQTRLLDIFNTYLYPTEARGNRPYAFYPDINGNFVLRTLDADAVDIEADYSLVHFSLDYPAKDADDDIYLYGAFNDWQLTEECRLKFNEENGRYETQVLFKQGFYNYTYVALDPENKLDRNKVEGSFYQTENDYSVVVYYRKFGDRYDRVIGYGKTNSEVLQN